MRWIVSPKSGFKRFTPEFDKHHKLNKKMIFNFCFMTTLFVSIFMERGICQQIYENKHNEKIILLNDSTIRFEFVYPDVEFNAKYDKGKDFLEITFYPYKVNIDTLSDESCSGFYIRDAEVYLTHNKGTIFPDPKIMDFIPYSFDSEIIQFEFRYDNKLELDPYVLENVEKGCYRLKFIYSNCVFVDMKSLNRIEIQKNGKQLVLNEDKYSLVK